MSDLKIELTKIYNVTSEVVYDAWLNPDAIRKFMSPAAGVTVPQPKIDPKVGGQFLFEMHIGEDLVLPHKGEYKVLDRSSKIQFTWNSANTDFKDSLVTILIKDLDDKSCELSLTHQMLPSESSVKDHTGGWTRITECLSEII